MDFDKQRSTNLAAQHTSIDFGEFDKWFQFFYIKADLEKQESLDLATENISKDFNLFKEWNQYFYIEVDLTKKEAFGSAFQNMHLDLERVKEVKDFLYLLSDYNRAKSAKLALEEKYYSIDIKAAKKLMDFFYKNTDLNRSNSFEQAIECIDFDFDEFDRKRNSARTLIAIRKVVEEMKSEYLARELAKLQVRQDTYQSGTKVEALWEDRANPKWNGWYSASIVAKQGAAWLVRYNEYPHWGDCLTNAANVRFPVGASIQAFWKDSMYEGWFAATVNAQNADGYLVRYKNYPQWGDCPTDKQNVRN